MTAENDTAKTEFGRFVKVAGGTPDMKKLIIYMKNTKITPDGGTNGLYEWSAGELTPVSVLPNGTVTNTIAYLGASGLNLSVNGGEGRMTATAISSDGNVIEWNEENNPHLYQRAMAQKETVQVDEVQSGAPQPKTFLNAVFQTASADGSKVFFTDSTRLTSNSKAPGSPAEPDLYVFEPGKPAGQRVTDLSVPLNAGESANVQGAIVGASQDGSLVYFVANGVLNSEHFLRRLQTRVAEGAVKPEEVALYFCSTTSDGAV